MIKVSLDEAYIFDLLSILDLKKDKSKNIESYNTHIENYHNLYLEILNQIGIEKLTEILNSEEYKELKETNIKVFDLVDLGLKDQGLAGETARENYKRFILKNKLQKKFFKNNLKEAKI
ncbi:MAG: hypothetical protein EBR82_50510 [Caulobacteraceae bacterium]|nr:hypothetical protein [Caulobacteraceae bacterium]